MMISHMNLHSAPKCRHLGYNNASWIIRQGTHPWRFWKDHSQHFFHHWERARYCGLRC